MNRSAFRHALVLAVSGLALAACTTTAAAAPHGVSAEAWAIHQRLMTLDTHLDTPAFFDTVRGYDITARHDVERDGSQVDYPRMVEGGLDGGFWVIYMGQGPLTPEGYRPSATRRCIRATSIQKMVAAHPDKFELALTSADAARINAAGKKIVYISMENSYELGEDLSLLDTFYKLGVRMAGPVHNGTNQLADSTNPGAVGMKWGGLSPMGNEYVRRANELGIMLDGSHSSDATIEQMIDLSATPIILSHHGADHLNEHPRNAPDALLKKLAAKGGVIHMNALGSFIKALPQTKERIDARDRAAHEMGQPQPARRATSTNSISTRATRSTGSSPRTARPSRTTWRRCSTRSNWSAWTMSASAPTGMAAADSTASATSPPCPRSPIAC